MSEQHTANTLLIDQAVDFFRTYADRTHHGKEEDILFRDLREKSLSKDHKKIMEELIEEHVQARNMVGRLVEAKKMYLAGSHGSLTSIADGLRNLIAFYPKHIIKEDKHFFFPCLDYFSQDEQNRMLGEFRDFDRHMIHEKYAKLAENFLGQKVMRPKARR